MGFFGFFFLTSMIETFVSCGILAIKRDCGVFLVVNMFSRRWFLIEGFNKFAH